MTTLSDMRMPSLKDKILTQEAEEKKRLEKRLEVKKKPAKLGGKGRR